MVKSGQFLRLGWGGGNVTIFTQRLVDTKIPNWTFLNPKIFKNNNPIFKKTSLTLTENFNFRDILSTFRAGNTNKNDLFRLRRTYEHFLKISKTTLKKKTTFLTKNMTRQDCQTNHKGQLLGPFSIYEL